MNKELIKKYKKEFDHWINEGSLLARVITSDEDDFLYTIWYEVDNKVLALEEWTSNYLFNLTDIQTNYYKPQFIIDDEYVEFRKAIIEGKTIQYYDCVFQHELCVNLDKYDWIDLSIATSSFTFSDKLKYRIKPEEVIESIETKEPDIKIGDFVIRKDFNETYKCINIKDDLVDLQAGTRQITIGIEHITHWQPQHGELCWFTNNKNENIAIIDKFHSYKTNSKFLKFKSNNSSFLYCEPFLNSKPSWFKD